MMPMTPCLFHTFFCFGNGAEMRESVGGRRGSLGVLRIMYLFENIL